MVKPIGISGLVISYIILITIFVVSYLEQLKIEKDILISYFRMSVQLFLAGFILIYIFKIDNAILNTIIFLFMIFFASRIVVDRSGVKIKNAAIFIFLSILISSTLVLIVLLFGIVGLDKLNARYFIPLAGMVIGNSMNSTAVGIERFFSKIKDNRNRIEDLLALGATQEEALSFIRRDALKAALLPSLASASGMGVVFLPGMMTGQIISGVVPTQAVYYQIVIVIAIGVTACLSNYIMVKILSKNLKFCLTYAEA